MAITVERFADLLRFERRGATELARAVEPMGDYLVERLDLRIGGETVRGLLTRPAEASGRRPAIFTGTRMAGDMQSVRTSCWMDGNIWSIR